MLLCLFTGYFMHTYTYQASYACKVTKLCAITLQSYYICNLSGRCFCTMHSLIYKCTLLTNIVIQLKSLCIQKWVEMHITKVNIKRMHNIKTLCFCNFSSASVSNFACLQRDLFVPTVYIHILSSLRIHKQKSEEN